MLEEVQREKPFDFARHSTIACGGKARQAFYPQTEEALCALSARYGRQAWILGNLSNVLPMDEDTDKTVISTKKLSAIRRVADGVYVEAGVISGKLLRFMQDTGCGGVEFLAGIPCTLGGIFFMNGGAGGQYIAQWLNSVRIYRNGHILDLPVKECGYAYKQSVFMQTNDVILGGTLRLRQSTPQAVKTEIKGWLDKRAHLPKGNSMGCVFKNPPQYAAGELIERAGLKGTRVGGAIVSTEHANFILNERHATAREICTLIEQVKDKVYQCCGIVLEEEIRYLQ